MLKPSSSGLKIVLKNLKDDIKLASKGPNSITKSKIAKISFKKLRIKIQSNQRLDVVMKTVFRISRRYFTNDFNRVTNYIKTKRNDAKTFYLSKISKYVKKFVQKNKNDAD